MARKLTKRAIDQAVAGVKAGHIMAGMPLTGETEAVIRRVAAGELSVDDALADARDEAVAPDR